MATPRTAVRRTRRATDLAFDAGAAALAGQEMLEASHAVIARRLEIAQGMMTRPSAAGLIEMGLMGSEKVEAFSSAGASLAAAASEIAGKAARVTQREAEAFQQAGARALAAETPAALAAVQAGYLTGLWSRAWSDALALGAASVTAQAEALKPIRDAAVANAQRLKGRG